MLSQCGLKEIINTAVIILLVVWVVISFNQSRQNTLLVEKLENITISYSDTILNQIIENQHTIIGNLTEHRITSNLTYFHLDDEMDEVLRILGSNITFDEDFQDQRETGGIASLS